MRKSAYAPTTDVPPNAVMTVDRQYGTSPLLINFSAALTTDANGGPLTYSWDFGDGTPTGSGVTTAHTYPATGIGTFTATLTARDSGNLGSSATVLVAVNNTPPTATIVSHANYSLYSILAPTATGSWTPTTARR